MRSWIRARRLSCIVLLWSSITCDIIGGASTAAAQFSNIDCGGNAVMQIVAHADDDLLFMSPDLLQDVRSERCVRTVFVTAGDAGHGADYWQGREAGARAAYASMAGVSDHWQDASITVLGHPIAMQVLGDRPSVSLAFLRLPDGCTSGQGCGDRYNGDSIERLWFNERSIRPVDGSSRYASDELVRVLAQLIRSYRPSLLRVQNNVHGFDDNDHPDHHTAAYFAAKANETLSSPVQLVSYLGYPSANQPENVFGDELAGKQNAFFTYAQHDMLTCSSVPHCDSPSFEVYGRWLRRQYVVGGGGWGGPTYTFKPTRTPFRH
jgi:LmbE family N-acetylglucosaminyl deacetylase